MNVNALRDLDNDPGFYIAVSSSGKTWPGAVIYQSSDGGASYQSIASIKTRATMGFTLNALGSYEGGNTVDEINQVRVSLLYGALSSVTFDAFLEGARAALIGDELIYFRTAHLNADRTYTLSGLLRGRRGTENKIFGHMVADRFVLLTPATVKRIGQVTADIGKTRLYKAVTSGAEIASAAVQAFKNEGAALKPYSPAHVGGGRAADGALLLSWVRRGRLSGEWRDSVDVPLSEEIEQYDIEFCTPDFLTVLKTVTVKNASSYTYEAADQAADFGSLQASVYVRVYQISATVGRGYPATAVI
jgi:hypothetical protein